MRKTGGEKEKKRLTLTNFNRALAPSQGKKVLNPLTTLKIESESSETTNRVCKIKATWILTNSSAALYLLGMFLN